MTKIALITGATSGFGAAAVRRFAKAGWRIVATGRRADRLKQLAAECGADNVFVSAFDMRKPHAIEAALDKLPDSLRDLDLLVNNAGLALGTAPAQKASLDQWNEMIETNVIGLVTITHKLLPALIARKGAIINGQYVPLGGTYGNAKLIRITATGVTLKTDQGLEVLQLYPSVGKAAGVSGAEGKPEKMAR